jgi:DNA-binding SARP family transcriptional activator/ABC-type transport system substrate-binding protein
MRDAIGDATVEHSRAEGVMEFRILGPFEVEDDGRTIPLAGAKQRALLALLVLSRGRPVSTDRLIEDVWNGSPPETALKSIQVYVSQLRKALGEARLVTRERGYELVLSPGELDADRFDGLVQAAAEAAPEQAAILLREALSLFRGEPLADLQLEPWAQAEIGRLEERRLSALEARVEADLTLARHRQLVPELQALVAAEPFREHFLEQLMLALYRSGRQAEALDAYKHGAGRLRDELGLAPGRGLQELERRVLEQDPRLDPPPTPDGRREARRRGWKLLVAGAGAVLAAATAAVIVVVTRGAAASLTTVAPGVAIVDAANGRLVATIPQSQIKYPAEVTAADGSFWIWTIYPFSMVRIEPKDGRVLSRISSPLDNPTAYLVQGRNLWLGGTRLVQIDIARQSETNRYSLSHDPRDDGLSGLTAGDGSLWVARQHAGELLRLDPASGTIQHRFPNLPDVANLAYGDGALWIASANGIERIDAKTNTVTATAHVPQPTGGARVAVGGGYAWASNETKGTVYKLDQSGQIVSTYETGDGARQMSYSDGTLWVVNQDVGSVTGIDGATGAERTFRFGHPLQSVAALNGKLLVEINSGRTYDDLIDALKGKVARLIIPIYQFDHPDPAIGNNPTIFMAERATCAPLLAYPDAPPPRGQHLVPEVAAEMPTLSHDRRTYTFTVRTGFRFAPPSNVPVDAATFRYSIERALNPKLGPLAPGIGYLGDLQGAQAFRDGRAPHISGIQVQRDRISFTLTNRSPDFLERLALPFFCPVPRDTPIVSGGVGVYTGPAPPGAGPYTFSGLVFNGEYAILKRNPNYGGPRPQRLDAIGLREGIDTEKAVGRVESGSWDGVETADPLLAPDGDLAHRLSASNPPGAVRYSAFPQRSTSYLARNARRSPFANSVLRRAVAAALDRASLAAFWNQAPTHQLLPTAVWGTRTPRLATPVHALQLGRLRHIVVRMGVQAGDEQAQQFVGIVHTALEPLGIDVQEAVVDNLAAAIRDPTTDIRLAAMTTSIDYPDPASFLARLFERDVPAAWQPNSVRGAVEHLASLAGSERDHAAFALASRLATQDVPVVVYGTDTLGAVVGPRLGCGVWNGSTQGLDLAALCLKSP